MAAAAVVGPAPKDDAAASAAPPSVDDLVAEITQHTAGLKPLLRPCAPMSLAWEDVTVEVPDRSAPGPAADGSPRTRLILNKVSGNVVPGELVAILGSSYVGDGDRDGDDEIRARPPLPSRPAARFLPLSAPPRGD